MEPFIQALRNLGPMRLAVMGGVAFAFIIFFVVLTTRFAAPGMDLLYGDLDTKDSARIVSLLESQGVSYDIRQGGTQLYVPSDKVSRLRLSLADQGLPSGGSMGYELFDKTDTLGTTNFMQNVNLVRALEGELARTIQSITNVRQARVHLVLPRRELFSREKQQPSASVVLRMQGANRLNPEQVAAVQHLVAAAVPGLTPNRISIVDNKGKLLARGFEEDAGLGTMAERLDEKRRSYESRIARTIEELVEKTVGFGKVRAEVAAEMDFDRISTSEERFDPAGQVVRSTQTVEESNTSREADGAPPVSVGTSLPDASVTGGESSGSASAGTRTEEVVNYEVSKKIINHVREAGVIKRLSVAVLVDGVRTPNPDGTSKYDPRPQQQMELLATLVRGAIGFNAERGDKVEIINMEFREIEEVEKPLELFFGMDKNDLLRMAEIMVLAIVAVLVILLVVRPLVSRAFEAVPSAAAAAERLMAEQAGVTPALTGPGGVPMPAEGAPMEEEFEELIDIDRVEGRVKASSVKKVGEIVEKHPEEALSIVRSWLYQES
jgi:flagellar M-ring protein FliF